MSTMKAYKKNKSGRIRDRRCNVIVVRVYQGICAPLVNKYDFLGIIKVIKTSYEENLDKEGKIRKIEVFYVPEEAIYHH